MHRFFWTDESVAFMCRAAERSEYYALLAKNIASFLVYTPQSLYEPGCGTGDLSMALSPFVVSLTAADIDPLPLKALKERARERGLTNITVKEEDAFSLSDPVFYEAAVFCFFGMPDQILSFAKAHVKKDVFVIKRAYTKHRFSVSDIPVTGDSLSGMCALLENRDVPYEKTVLDMELGQPLKDLEEARRFFSLYSRDDKNTVFSDETLLSRLTVTNDREYPSYLPGRKKVGLIHFKSEAL